MSGVVGNRAVLRREDVLTPLGRRSVPCLSGNAIRHALREAGSVWLADAGAMPGGLTQPEVYYLISGGSGFGGRGGREAPANDREMRRLLPHGSILGGCTPRDIFGGRLAADFGVLVCAENARRLQRFLPPDVHIDGLQLRPAEACIGRYLYTRHALSDMTAAYSAEVDLAERRAALAAYKGKRPRPGRPEDMWLDGEDPDKSQQMLYEGECVIAGAAFVHRLRLHHCSRVEVGALLWALRLWQYAGGHIGGMAARGHGQLATAILLDPEPDGDPVAEYIRYAQQHAREAADWIRRQFRPEPRPEGTASSRTSTRTRRATS
jgi:hypothetical protein